MAGTTTGRTAERLRVRSTVTRPARRAGAADRHPLVAAAMAVPLALLLAVACGGWHAVVVQASSVAGLMGR